MKHIFRKLHLGSSHDPHRSNDIHTVSPLSCASDHRTASVDGGHSPATTSSAAAGPPPPPPSVRPDYYASEEEFQVQLAMAISASNLEVSTDPDSDQIRTATLISLGKGDSERGAESAAEAMSRRYWDYSVLDYEQKVIDGFYDIYGLPTTIPDYGKMPSLLDLQTNPWDLGFEAVIVNQAIDPALEELQQVAQCVALDCPATEVNLLVQRIADLVTEHMGGPVRDANIMLAKWMERSVELKSSLQTSVLPIGYLNIGLSRHRSLLFKVLADSVGLPCRLVKGSHYTGVDDDAVNIIKSENGREFLVDLMAAPGTLIPADVLCTKDGSWNLSNSVLINDKTNDSVANIAHLGPHRDSYSGNDYDNNKGFSGNSSSTLFVSPTPTAGDESSLDVWHVRNLNFGSLVPAKQPHMLSSSASASSSRSRNGKDFQLCSDDMIEKTNVTSEAQGCVNLDDLFADLNPFHAKAQKIVLQGKSTASNEFQKHTVAVAPRPGRSYFMWKHRGITNEIPRSEVHNEAPSIKKSSENSGVAGTLMFPSMLDISEACKKGSSAVNITEKPHIVSNRNCTVNVAEQNKQLSVHSDGDALCSLADRITEQDKNGYSMHDKNKQNIVDMTGRTFGSMDVGCSMGYSGLTKCERILDDVAECEIIWEDLVIGERIGLGSYGEVYHADWNGTEVAVKKFLDQDFSGDALDEFRREVRIMRRLRHPNVVLFMGAVTRPPNLSIVTEFLRRGSLYRLLHRPNSQIDEKRRIKMALDVAKGMNCLHSSTPTIVHRDLKSANLLVDNNWNVKVCDFGLSRLKHNTFLSSKSTAGTPEWMAPEVLRNEPSNEKCDVYSFGVILWELATLRMPWHGMNPMQVVGAVGFQNRRLDIPKEVDPLVARIIWECWQTDPNLRPSFAQLTSALKPLQQLVISNQQLDATLLSHQVPVILTP